MPSPSVLLWRGHFAFHIMAISTSISSNISTSISTSISSGDEGGWSGLTFTSTGTSTIWLNNQGTNNPNCEYSLNKGKNWTAMPTTSASAVEFSSTTPIWVRGNNLSGWSTSNSKYSGFVFQGSYVNGSGSVMSLLDGKGTAKIIPCNYCFNRLFYNTGTYLITPPKLPATTLTEYCYNDMFRGCTRMTSIPKLPATTLAASSYAYMFYGCQSITSAEFQATSMTTNSCIGMFYGCSALSEVHVHVVDTTASGCTNLWLGAAAQQGTLYTPAYYAGYAQDSTSGCPSGWSRVDAIPAPDNVILFSTYESGAGNKVISSNTGSLFASYFSDVYVNGQHRNLDVTQSLKQGANFVVLQAVKYGSDDQQSHLFKRFANDVGCNANFKVIDLSYFKFTVGTVEGMCNECRALTTVYGWDNLKWWSNISIDKFRITFQYCNALLHLHISPTQPYIGECMYSHNWQVQDEVINIPSSIKAIFPEHAFHKCSVDAAKTKAFSVTDNPNFFVGSQGELYGKWKAGSATEAWFLIATPMMAELTNDTFVIDDRCQCLGNLSMAAFGLQRNPSTIQLGDNLVYRPEGFGDRGKGIAAANRGANFVTALFNDTTFTSYAVKSTNTRYSVGADGCLYSKDGSTLLSVPRGFSGNLTINCQKIGAGAFAKDYIWDYPNLGAITIGNNVTEIDQHQIQHLSEMKAAGSHDKVVIDSSHNYFVFDNEYVLRSRKKNHLTFTSTTSTLGKVYIEVESGAPSFQCKYSTDQGSTWTDMPTTSTNAVEIPQSGMWVKGLKVGSTGFADGKVRFNISNTPVKVSGNLSSLIDDGDGNLFYIPTGVTHCFDNLFNSPIASPSAVRTKLDISEVYLPYSEASNYNYTFRNVQCAVLPEIKWPFIHDNFKDCFDNATNTWFQSIRINAWYVGPNAGSGIPTSNPSATVYCHDTELPFIDLNLSKSARNFAAGKTAKPYDYFGTPYLMFEGSSTFTSLSLGAGDSVEFSDNGVSWSSWDISSPHVVTNGKAYVRAKTGSSRLWGFTGSFTKVSGNVMSLVDYEHYTTVSLNNNQFYYNDGSSHHSLFWGVTTLTDASNLLFTASVLKQSCYCRMFQNCTSLITPPALPATTLATTCYEGMFYGCSNLTSAPALPATTLANGCYASMIRGCYHITKAPELPASTLVVNCYNNMFNSCTAINEVHCDAINITASGCLTNWLAFAPASGDFYGKSAANWPSGASGIPEGWTRHLD